LKNQDFIQVQGVQEVLFRKNKKTGGKKLLPHLEIKRKENFSRYRENQNTRFILHPGNRIFAASSPQCRP